MFALRLWIILRVNPEMRTLHMLPWLALRLASVQLCVSLGGLFVTLLYKDPGARSLL